ncbi:MAG: hypothetical protein Q7J44_14250 [Pseudotabrizicola sp.]|uniref:hypothetical protein n=1 Tax=Pseudotabrizicola sp. TaxID=2939647 RepID=UPI0027189DF6|nr:hypothetical protein [Pseudotabrizicola sp.]MDO9639698.1 hypothetical protein [Pseudotabrizicola sp.]
MKAMPRPLYIIFRVLHDLVAVGSRLINAAGYEGSTHDTLSSRSYFDGHTYPEWARRRRFINRLFFWQEDHCRADYLYGLEQARKKLERHEALMRLEGHRSPTQAVGGAQCRQL